MKRHTAREKAFQVLFQLDLSEFNPRQVLQDHLNENEQDDADPFLEALVQGVADKQDDIDAAISNQLEKWSFDRIALVEKTVLRIAVYEMHYVTDIPTNVSINEAVELAKTYGDEKSGKFVNGVLSKLDNA